MSSSGRINGRDAPAAESPTDSRDEWCVHAVSLVQAIIGCAYGFVSIDDVEKMAAAVPPPATRYQHVLIRGVVFECLMRKLQSVSPAECALVTGIVQEMARTSRTNVRRTIADIRALLGIRGPDLAERIRDIIDARYAQKLLLRAVARELKASVKEAKSAFEEQFGLSISDYLTRRRVGEGMQMVRAGISIEAAALNVGWRGKRHFYDAVREVWGTTPALLRDHNNIPSGGSRKGRTS